MHECQRKQKFAMPTLHRNLVSGGMTRLTRGRSLGLGAPVVLGSQAKRGFVRLRGGGRSLALGARRARPLCPLAHLLVVPILARRRLLYTHF